MVPNFFDPMAIYRPVGNKIIVAPEPETEKSRGGIILPNRREHFGPKVFRVIRVGPKVRDVEADQRVLCYDNTSGPIPIEDGSGWSFITEDQVLMVIP